MRNISVLLITLFFISTISAQIDTANLVVKSDENAYLYRQNFKNENDFDGGSLFKHFIIFNRLNSSLRFIKRPLQVYADKQIRFVDMDQLDLTTQELKKINSWKTDDYEKRKSDAIILDSLILKGLQVKDERQAKADSLFAEARNLKEKKKQIEDTLRLKNEFKRLKNLGIGIYYDWDEEKLLTTTSQSFYFEIYNYAKKSIKYIYVTLGAYNRVDDLISKKQVTLVGPIEPNDIGTSEFSNVFFSNVFEYALMHEVKIQYFDGSVKIFSKSNAESIRMSLNLQHYLFDN